MAQLDETHDPALRSWVASANPEEGTSDFPIQNLPHGVFRPQPGAPWRGGVAIGDQVLDMAAASRAGIFDATVLPVAEAAGASELNALMAMSPERTRALRLALSRALRKGSTHQAALAPCLHPQSRVEFTVPARIGDYTDFYTSIHHATSVGRLFRPDNPLMPNYRWIPIGYHGRASSIGVSGQGFARPRGQLMPAGAPTPVFGASKRMDYELEIGIWIGQGNAIGESIALDDADQHVFGLCLLNDWSARDIQAWEYQPLGPFLAKNFATTISPWIVTLEALAPYRVPWQRPADDPQPLPYLESDGNRQAGGFDLFIEAWLETDRMRREGRGPARLSRSNFCHSYWSVGQMVAHHTVGGCNLNAGDLLGSGTQSGPEGKPEAGSEAAQAGALIELSTGGKNPVALGNGETRTFLEDNDTVIFKGWCERPGAARIGFGECRGTVLPARG